MSCCKRKRKINTFQPYRKRRKFSRSSTNDCHTNFSSFGNYKTYKAASSYIWSVIEPEGLSDEDYTYNVNYIDYQLRTVDTRIIDTDHEPFFTSLDNKCWFATSKVPQQRCYYALKIYDGFIIYLDVSSERAEDIANNSEHNKQVCKYVNDQKDFIEKIYSEIKKNPGKYKTDKILDDLYRINTPEDVYDKMVGGDYMNKGFETHCDELRDTYENSWHPQLHDLLLGPVEWAAEYGANKSKRDDALNRALDDNCEWAIKEMNKPKIIKIMDNIFGYHWERNLLILTGGAALTLFAILSIYGWLTKPVVNITEKEN